MKAELHIDGSNVLTINDDEFMVHVVASILMERQEAGKATKVHMNPMEKEDSVPHFDLFVPPTVTVFARYDGASLASKAERAHLKTRLLETLEETGWLEIPVGAYEKVDDSGVGVY